MSGGEFEIQIFNTCRKLNSSRKLNYFRLPHLHKANVVRLWLSETKNKTSGRSYRTHNYKMEKKFKLLPPQMPNFITYDTGVIGKKQDGFNANGNTLPVASLSESEAMEYAELMKNTFLEHYKKKCSE